MRWRCCFETCVPQITTPAWPPRSDGAGATDVSHTSRPTGHSVPYEPAQTARYALCRERPAGAHPRSILQVSP